MLLLTQCDKDITGTEDQPLVRYTLFITDSATSLPIPQARIEITQINQDTATYFTDSLEGKAEIAQIQSGHNLFIISKPGYRTLDQLDTVAGTRDSIFNRPIFKVLRISLSRNGISPTDTLPRLQYRIRLRGESQEPLTRGIITYRDSFDIERKALDEGASGEIGLMAMLHGPQSIHIEHPGYLGRILTFTLESVSQELKADTSRRNIPFSVVSLLPLKNSITGQVFRKSARGQEALPDAWVEFTLIDSAYFPRTFRALTSSQQSLEGQFQLDSIPELPGELRFYKDKFVREPSLILPISREEVALHGPLKPIILSIAGDSVGAPVLLGSPKDTLLSGDTLRFTFNQPVEEIETISVRLVNLNNRLFTSHTLSADGKSLTIIQKEAPWQSGRLYGYELRLKNTGGEYFHVPGDTVPGIRGFFYVPVRSDSAIAEPLIPMQFRLAYFNSGKFSGFDSLDAFTSPLADSTTNYGRLKWSWPISVSQQSGELRKVRVDSLEVWLKDSRSYDQWMLWQTLPGHLDSATLIFPELYATAGFASTRPSFPLRISTADAISLRILPKHRSLVFEERDTILSPVRQDMGPSILAFFSTPRDSIWMGGATGWDTLLVRFGTGEKDSTLVLDTAGVQPLFHTSYKGFEPGTGLLWEWTSVRGGRLIYTTAGVSGLLDYVVLKLDLSHIQSDGKPVWLRNRDPGYQFKRK